MPKEEALPAMSDEQLILVRHVGDHAGRHEPDDAPKKPPSA